MKSETEYLLEALSIAWTMLMKIEHGGSFTLIQWHQHKREILDYADHRVRIVPGIWSETGE